MHRRGLRVAVLGTRGIPDVMGGVESHCQALYPRLAKRGVFVTVFARKRYVGRSRPYEYMGVRVVPLWTTGIKSLEAIFHTAYGLARVILHKTDFDVLHIHAIGPSLLVPVARLLGLKVVMTHHGQDYERKKWGRMAKLMLRMGESLGCRFSSSVIAVSKNINRLVREAHGREGRYIPNGVAIPDAVPPGGGLKKRGLVPGQYLLAVARFVPEKGLHDLLAAFSEIDTGWRLVIAGSADHEDGYSRSLRRQAAADARVVLTGFVKGRELAELYSNAGLFVMPSYHEGLPIALLEAMSYGLPVIASGIPANMEIAFPEEAFPPGEVTALKEKIESFISCPERPDNRKRVEFEYDWDKASSLTEEVYSSVCAR